MDTPQANVSGFAAQDSTGDARLVSNVSDTARWAAAFRAIETSRPDAVFKDPFAERLAGEQGMAIAARSPRQVRNGWPVVVRTKLMDDLLLASVDDGCDCVLNLAAGLDTRPYRLTLPSSLRWIDVDLPAMIDETTKLLAGERPCCQLFREKIDLADVAALAPFLDKVLGDRTRALVITEGLLMYLSEETVRSLARELARPAVAWWMLDTMSPMIRDSIMQEMQGVLASAPMLFAPPDGIGFFEALGWKTLEVRSALHEAARLRRLPWLLQLFSMLPIPEPDPRNVANARWSAIVRLGRGKP
jgi:methyltransferase (TIGR00027 family)